MYGYVSSKGESVGFGVTREEAEMDAYVNKCRTDISADTDGLFKARRDVLKPWIPKPNMLHLSGVGCLIYENGKLYNSKNGKYVHVQNCRYAVFRYLMELCGEDLSYTDILVSLQPELDIFLKHVNPDFVNIRELPIIRVVGNYSGFSPKIIYTLDEGLSVGISEQAIGVRKYDEELFHVVELEHKDYQADFISYLGSRVGYVINTKGVIKYGKEAQEF